METTSTRRTFLGAAGAAAAVPWVDARTYAAAGRAPNDVVRIGLIGCGGRGRDVMRNFLRLPDARLVAVCDVHAGRMTQARQIAGGEAVRPYRDYRDLLANKDVDAVIVATAGHWHVLPTIHACQAGKDVYVEKPLGTSIGEGRAAVRAARKYNRVVQIGTQQRSWEHYQRAVEVIQSGRLGDISEVKVWDNENHAPGYGAPPDDKPPAELDWDFWLGPAPKRPFNKNRFGHSYWFFDYGGGWPLDWAVHHYDIVQWALKVKYPVAAVALGGRIGLDPAKDDREWPDTFGGVLEYGPGPLAKRGFLLTYTFRSAGRGGVRNHGKEFFGTEASLILDRSGYTITHEQQKGRPTPPAETFVGRDENHAEVFVRHVKARTRPLADVEEGHYASNPGHLLNIAWRLGRKIRWDGEKERVLGDDEANALVTRTYRAPWKLEV
ncbi:MAG: Gfo/Idh/MocA family oxidoreductase [Gemmataceae bacterium]